MLNKRKSIAFSDIGPDFTSGGVLKRTDTVWTLCLSTESYITCSCKRLGCNLTNPCPHHRDRWQCMPDSPATLQRLWLFNVYPCLMCSQKSSGSMRAGSVPLTHRCCFSYLETQLNRRCYKNACFLLILPSKGNSSWFLTFAKLIAKSETHCVMLVKLNINSYVYFSFVICLFCVLCLFFSIKHSSSSCWCKRTCS